MEKDKDYMEKIRYLEEYINKVKMKSEKIQKNFTFEIPNIKTDSIMEEYFENVI